MNKDRITAEEIARIQAEACRACGGIGNAEGYYCTTCNGTGVGPKTPLSGESPTVGDC